MMRGACACLLAAVLAGCASTPMAPDRPLKPMPGPVVRNDGHGPLPALPAAGSGRGGYYQDDGPGENPPANLGDTPDAVVKTEPYARYANRPYVVFGKTYTPLLNEDPFVQRGQASWYGKKFHGQRTSSGELYDMYKMSAAHPTLPIPSYARVTSVGNGQSVVVRINDRGPFHASRVIDVSYTAALKLGLLDKGSHEVEVERILPNDTSRIATTRRNAPQAAITVAAVNPGTSDNASALLAEPETERAPAPGFYVQLGAFSRADKAEQVRASLDQAEVLPAPLEVVKAGAVHRIISGPYASRDEAARAARDVPGKTGLKPIVVKR
jgi:rare lipoprotein A